ncbi:hypothetical protein ACEE_03065 [Actinobacillus equuli subsp. equuli]|nr:hypothetical protein ACEE_03065 [Actinobacillus equuli subsp. equuli]
MKKTLAALAVAMLMSSCSNTNGSEMTVTTVITGCETFSLIYPSRADTAETKRQVLAHNLTYEEICREKVDKKN